MTKTHRRRQSAAALSLAFMLGGCQIFGGGTSTASAGGDPAAVMTDFGGEQIAEGRKALIDGRTAEAIDSFMLAKAYPEHAPAALNGLAVAYSRIGRPDLTERFFRGAIALAPAEDRYRANLALFYSRNPMPRASEPALALASISLAQSTNPNEVERPTVVAVPEREPPVRRLGAGISVQSPPGRMQRLSRSEVTVSGSAKPPPAVRADATRRAVIQVGARTAPSYPIRMTLADPAPLRRNVPAPYPVRIELDD